MTIKNNDFVLLAIGYSDYILPRKDVQKLFDALAGARKVDRKYEGPESYENPYWLLREETAEFSVRNVQERILEEELPKQFKIEVLELVPASDDREG